MNKIFFSLVVVGVITILGYQNPTLVQDYALRLRAALDWRHTSHKELLRPYFDAAYYRRTYAHDLEKTGLDPLDHFLTYSGMCFSQAEFNPTPHFPTTLYNNYLWHRPRTWFSVPYLHYLQYQYPAPPEKAATIRVFCASGEETRAWMACEELLRRGSHNVHLILGPEFSDIPLVFKKQTQQGLHVQYAAQPVTFYQSAFLYDPHFWPASRHFQQSDFDRTEAPMFLLAHPSGITMLCHQMYRSHKWKKRAKLAPLMLNVGKYAHEPHEFSDIDRTTSGFQKKVAALAPGFDLLLLNTKLPNVAQAKILPGYLKCLDRCEISPRDKSFSLGYMLSLGGKGFKNYKDRGALIYSFRKRLWDLQGEILTIPRYFYISRRDIHHFPKAIHDRVAPPSGKCAIYHAQFVVAIENVRQKHYMSEKLLDCFINLSIPIYIGMPNIQDYFDPRGMFIAQDPEDIVRIANSLTPETYDRMLPYLRENQRRALDYLVYDRKLLDHFAARLQRHKPEMAQ